MTSTSTTSTDHDAAATETVAKLEAWFAAQVAAYEQAKARMTEAFAANNVVAEWVFEDLIKSQAYVLVAHYMKNFLDADGLDLGPLNRHAERTVFGYSAPRTATEGFTQEAWTKVARILRGLGSI